MKTNFWLIILISCFGYAQNIDYKRMGPPFYPEQELSEKDSLTWPLELEISIDVKDISEIDYKNTKFRTVLLSNIWSDYEKEFISNQNDTISLRHDELVMFQMDFDNPLNKSITNTKYYNKNEYPYLMDNKHLKSVQLIETPLNINWNYRDFPFDKQKLIYRYTTTVDTSIIKLFHSNRFPSSYSSNMENLKDGYLLGNITTNYKYNQDTSDIIQITPDLKRPIVTETLEIIISLSRNGSWLFLKLFIGGIISYFISCLMFLLPKEEFESKMTLAVGAIFGAIGNRYFVDSTLPGIQVLTKADLISNLIIAMVAINLLAVILQRSQKITFIYLESENYDFFYSIYSFIILLMGIVLW